MKKNRWCYLGFGGLFLLGIVVWSCLFHMTRKVITVIPLTFPDTFTPCVATHIQGGIYYLKINFDSKLPLTLNKDILEKIEKSPHGTLEWTTEKGEKFSAPSYLVPSIKVGETVFKDVIICATREEEPEGGAVGEIGRPLLIQHSLFLDFPHSMMIVGENLSSLQKAGLYVGKTVKIPFKLNRGGIVVKVSTDLGLYKFSLSTSASHIIIRANQVKNLLQKQVLDTSPEIESIRFGLAGEEFGYQKLYPYDLTDILHEIDGSIGMDFLKHHSLYYDFKNLNAYIDKVP